MIYFRVVNTLLNFNNYSSQRADDKQGTKLQSLFVQSVAQCHFKSLINLN